MPTEQASAKTLFVIVSVIGLIYAIVMVILFFNAAPARSNIEVHRASDEAVECLKCHLRGDEKSPTMPHLNLGRCNLCHGLSKEEPQDSQVGARQPNPYGISTEQSRALIPIQVILSSAARTTSRHSN